MKKIQREAAEQEALFRWAEFQQGKFPELGLMFHVPNGGSRNELEAVNLKRQGVKAGVPDVWLPVAKGNFHGMIIEMKAGKNKTTSLQEKWLSELSAQGYYATVCYGWLEATNKIMQYLNL